MGASMSILHLKLSAAALSKPDSDESSNRSYKRRSQLYGLSWTSDNGKEDLCT